MLALVVEVPEVTVDQLDLDLVMVDLVVLVFNFQQHLEIPHQESVLPDQHLHQ
jgi:hypothetical protein